MMGYIPPGRCEAMVYAVEANGTKARLVLIGTAVVGEDGRSLLVSFDEIRTVGPETPLVVKGV